MNKLSIAAVVSFVPLLGLVFGRYGSAQAMVAENSLYWVMAWSVLALLVFPKKSVVLPISRVGLAIVALILGYGWLMAVNARAEYNLIEIAFEPPSYRFWKSGPGSVTQSASLTKMIEVSGLFLAFFAAVRSRDSRVWRLLLASLPILGALIAMVGLFHRVLDARTIWFVEQRFPPPQTFFAPFVYNGNAGAVLNFFGALGFSFWVSSFWKGSRSKTIGWAIVTALCFLGVIATASKGAFLIFLFTIGLCLLLHRKRLCAFWPEIWAQFKGRGLEGKILALFMTMIVLAFSTVGMQKLVIRMDDFMEDAQDGKASTVEGRLGIMRVMAKMARIDEGGWAGFGPGSFQYLVPYFMVDKEYYLEGRWIHGHSDPLQLLVEWGYIGAFLWIILGLGAFRGGLQALKSDGDPASKPLIRGMMIALVSMVLHSAFDFPFGIFSLKLVAVFVCGMLWGRRVSEKSRIEQN